MNKIRYLIIMLFFIACGKNIPGNILDGMPGSIGKFSVSGETEKYDRETLFNYINGGAELYLTYDFRQTFVKRYVHESDPELEIVVDVYEMGTPEEAFGIFSSEREDEEAGIGIDSEFGGGLLRFWKNRYFVSIVILGEPEEHRDSMMNIARAAADLIPEGGSRPALLESLPVKSRIETETRYFHAVQSLNNQYYIADENILGLGPETDCVMSMYERAGENYFLLIIRYANEEAAEQYYDSFIGGYMPEAAETGTAQMENGRWTAARWDRNHILIVFEAPNSERAEDLLSEVFLN